MPDFIIKVCGLTNREDAQAAIDAGANALGFNFYPNSPRYLTPARAAEIITALHGSFLRVGIFVNPAPAEFLDTAFLDVTQIHGRGHSQLPTWRAIAVGTTPPPDPAVEAYLLDTPTPAHGGSGQTFNWHLAANFPHRAIIAGGLDAINVAEAIRIANPWGVDSCSRLETSPGRKDHTRMAAFIDNARAAFHSQQAVHI